MRYFIISIFIIASISSCSRATTQVLNATVVTPLMAKQKVFVTLDAPYEKETTTIKLIPKLTRALREHGLEVSSSANNRNTTEDIRTRSAERLKAFAPDYILKVKQAKNQKLVITTPTGKSQTVIKQYDLVLLNAVTNQQIWSAQSHGKQNFIGLYHDRLVRSMVSEMETSGVLLPLKKK
jgi:hypothetical protein